MDLMILWVFSNLNVSMILNVSLKAHTISCHLEPKVSYDLMKRSPSLCPTLESQSKSNREAVFLRQKHRYFFLQVHVTCNCSLDA